MVTLKEAPTGYETYHEYLDIQSLLPQEVVVSEDNDPYLVERIVKKRFRNNQYEYLVKWLGYGEKENTWELPSNIPSCILSAFERAQATPSTYQPRREGLQEIKWSTYRDDFIFNA